MLNNSVLHEEHHGELHGMTLERNSPGALGPHPDNKMLIFFSVTVFPGHDRFKNVLSLHAQRTT